MKVFFVYAFLVIATGCLQAEAPAATYQNQADIEYGREQFYIAMHYHRPAGDYDDWNVWVWAEGYQGQAYDFTNEDSFGRVAMVTFDKPIKRVGFRIRKGNSKEEDVQQNRYASVSTNTPLKIWVEQGKVQIETSETRRLYSQYKNELALLDIAPDQLPSGYKKANVSHATPLLPKPGPENPIISNDRFFCGPLSTLLRLLTPESDFSVETIEMGFATSYWNERTQEHVWIYAALFTEEEHANQVFCNIKNTSKLRILKAGPFIMILWGVGAVTSETLDSFVGAIMQYQRTPFEPIILATNWMDVKKDQLDELVVVTLNTHSFQEETDNFKKLIWTAQGLAALNADLIGLNEVLYGNIFARNWGGVYYNTAEIIKSYLELITGDTYELYVKEIGKWQEGETLANAILSRYPLEKTNSTDLTTTDKWPAPHWKRNCLFAKVFTPSKKLIHFFVTHAMGWNSADTGKQIQEIKSFVKDKQDPTAYAEIIVGDYNIWPEHINYANWIDDEPKLIDTYALANKHHSSKQTALLKKRIDFICIGKDNPLVTDMDITSHIIFYDNMLEGIQYPRVSDHVGFVTTFTTHKID